MLLCKRNCYNTTSINKNIKKQYKIHKIEFIEFYKNYKEFERNGFFYHFMNCRFII